MDRGQDLETRCAQCHIFRYHDVHNEGTQSGQEWFCGPCSGVKPIDWQAKYLELLDAYNALVSGILTNIERDTRRDGIATK